MIKRVVDWREIWTLGDAEGLVMVAGDDEAPCLGVWPHPDYARAFEPSGTDAEPERIPLSAWLNRITPKLLAAGTRLAVFPLETGHAVVVGADRFRDDLLAYKALYY